MFKNRSDNMNENLKNFRQIKLFMVLCGQWLDFKVYPKFKLKVQQYRLWFFIILTPFSILSMFLSGFKDSLSKYAFFSAAGIFSASMAWSYLTGWELTKSIYYTLESILKKRTESYQIKMFKESSKPLWNVIKTYAMMSMSFALMYEIVPYFYDIYTAFVNDSKEPFMTPLPNQGYVGKHPRRTLYYYMITITTTIWCVSLNAIVFCYESSASVFILYTCVELKILSKRIQQWGNGTKEITLEEIINDHKTILKLTSEMKELLGGPMAVQNLMGSLSLTLYAYTVMLKFHTDMILVLVNLFCIFAVSGILFVANFMGERLQQESLLLFESLCQIPWYEMSPKIRKDLNMMIRQAKRPLVINYKNKSPLTLATLMQILNQSYSYFMVLKSMR